MELKNTLKQINTSGADFLSLREVHENVSHYYMRDGKPSHNGSSDSHGIMVEALVDGQFAYAATSDRSVSAINEAAQRAIANAKLASQYKVFNFEQKERPQAVGNYQSPYKLDYSQKTPGEINDYLAEVCKRLKRSDKIILTSAYMCLIDRKQNFVSTNGSESSQNFLLSSFNHSANAQKDTLVQSRSLGRSEQIGLELYDSSDMWEQIEQVGEQAIELLDADECPSGKMDLILSPDQMMLQIHESVGHALEIDRILGDERNYAGWSFVKLEDFGQLQYGSELMNITFDPNVSGQYSSYKFDDTGRAATKEYLIQKGKLLKGLGSLESEARSKIQGTANARASSWDRPALDRMANVNLEPGKSSREEMISSVDYGVLMETNKSWSIDDYRRKFQFGCEYGKLIEKGKITKTIRNPNYRAVSVPFWNSLKMLGNESTWEPHGVGNCGKAEPNQVARVAHASPLCLFGGIEVFGGAS